MTPDLSLVCGCSHTLGEHNVSCGCDVYGCACIYFDTEYPDYGDDEDLIWNLPAPARNEWDALYNQCREPVRCPQHSPDEQCWLEEGHYGVHRYYSEDATL